MIRAGGRLVERLLICGECGCASDDLVSSGWAAEPPVEPETDVGSAPDGPVGEAALAEAKPD
jgi:hypothetical protein